MSVFAAVLRRHALALVAAAFAAYFGISFRIESDRLTRACTAFAAGDALVRRAVPPESPWKQEIDEKRQAVAAICDVHFSEVSEQAYPVDPENR